MNIAIDISPLHTDHKVRGVGFYLQHLKKTLEQYFPDNSYTFFTQRQNLPNNINVVHYPYFDPFFLNLPFIKKNQTILTVHDLTPIIFSEHFPAGLRGNIVWNMQKILLQQVDAIITDSKNSKTDIIRCTGVSEKKVHVVYLAAGEEFVRIKNQELRIKEIKHTYTLPEKFVLYVGDVTWNKNLPRLLRAMMKTDVPLVMVGKALVSDNFDHSHPWNNDLVEVQRLAKNNKQIIRLGFVSTDDLVVLYNIATAFVMPSLYEGFGLPILEAMSCGVPVITTKEGSLPEVAGEAAHFVDAYSEESIQAGIQKVFSDHHLQRKLIEKGLEQAKKFSWKKTAEQTISVYQTVFKQ